MNVIKSVPIDSTIATIAEIRPTDLNLFIGKSVPITNNSIIIPSSANAFRVSILWINEKGGVYGPMIIPASIYPITADCFNL
jgi:hypothetical protein